jgi:transposase
MFFPEGQIRVQLYGQPVDMRKSFDGLSALAMHAMGLDPLSGALFVFINRRATQIKVLYFDRSGYCVWAKRLEAGRFIGDWRSVHSRAMDWTALKLLLEGIEPGRQRKRFEYAQLDQNASQKTSQNTVVAALPSIKYPHAKRTSGSHSNRI